MAHSLYAKKTFESEKPTEEMLLRTIQLMEEIYEPIRTDISRCFSYDNYCKILMRLDFTSTPGHPYFKEAPTIGQWLHFDGLSMDRIQVQRLWMDVERVIESEDLSEILWRCFIKQEAHKLKKKLSKRWRLIMAPPLHLQIVWRMCFGDMNDKEIDNAFRLPSQQGLIMPGGNWKMFYNQWKRENCKYGTDNEAWDWTVPGWLLKTELEFRRRLVCGIGVDKWYRVAAKLYENAFHSTRIILSDGRIFKQCIWGIMKSGCVNTISTNSHGQCICHCIYAFLKAISVYPLPKCCGDDKLQTKQFVEDLSCYERFGFKIKEVSDDYEFVGHKFTDDGPIPVYTGKHVYNLTHAHEDNVIAMFDGYLRLYAYDHEKKAWLKDIIMQLGLVHDVRSQQYYHFWYDNPYGLDKDFVRNIRFEFED